MTDEQARKIIDGLAAQMEECIILAAAQKVVINAHVDDTWDPQIIFVKEKLRGSLAEEFAKLRDMLLPASSETPLQADWNQIVQRLVDSIDDLGLSDPDSTE